MPWPVEVTRFLCTSIVRSKKQLKVLIIATFQIYKGRDADIFIASTSGGALDLSDLADRKINARLNILFAHGITQPKGLIDYPLNWIYSPSNFLCEVISRQWKITSAKTFVTPHGIEEKLFLNAINKKSERDPYTMIYAGHPSKGLDTAIAVLRILRQTEPRFTLHVFGGYQLWGEDLPLNIDEPGLKSHGLIGQRDLARKMQNAGFSLNLQAREEPFGMVITESMRAGCIVLASPVGAYPELIQNGFNGFLIPGDHTRKSRSVTGSSIDTGTGETTGLLQLYQA